MSRRGKAQAKTNVTKRLRKTKNTIIDLIINLMRRKNIWVRLFVLYVLSIMVLLTFLGSSSYISSSRTINYKVSGSIIDIMHQVSINLQEKLQEVEKDCIEISYSDDVQGILTNYNTYTPGMINQFEVEKGKDISRKYVFDDLVTEITLYTNYNNKIDLYGPDAFRLRPSEENLTQLTKEIRQMGGLWKVVGPEFEERLSSSKSYKRDSIIMGRLVKSVENGNAIGYIIMRINESVIRSIYENINISEVAQLFIIDDNGVIVSTGGDYANMAQEYPYPQLIESILISERTKQSFSLNIGQKPYYVFYSHLQGTNWYMVSALPASYLKADSEQLLKTILAVTLGCIVLSVFISVIVSKSIMDPIKNIVTAMNLSNDRILKVKIKEDGKDEITTLTRHFNSMSTKLNEMIEDIKIQEKQKSMLQLQALQAQINPHFLANSLNTISYLAAIKQEDNIEELANSIIDLLRACMKNDGTLIHIKDEIDIIKRYIKIQEYRTFDTFNIEIDLEKKIYNYMIPMFILQPIIENALIHGIMDLKHEGIIRIKGQQIGENLCFTIMDNGKGMKTETIQKLLNEQSNDNGRLNGLGISNVNTRIKLLYGPDYGISIQSKEGYFTSVTILLPIIRGKNNRV